MTRNLENNCQLGIFHDFQQWLFAFQSSRTDILDLLLNAEEVDVGNSGLADAVTQLLSVNMDSDAQDLQEKPSKQEENGIKKKKKKKGLTTEVNLNKLIISFIKMLFISHN